MQGKLPTIPNITHATNLTTNSNRVLFEFFHPGSDHNRNRENNSAKD